MEYNNDSLLMGNATRVPELDEEENDVRESDAERNYLFSEIVDKIGTDEFKNTYKALMDEVKSKYKDSQRDLCVMMLQKIRDVYGYELPYKFDTYDDKFVLYTYDLIDLLEVNYVHFLTMIWYYLGKDPRNVDIDEYCRTNARKIDEIINNEIDAIDYYEMSIVFLRTYDKIIDFIIERTKQMKMIVVLRILERNSL